MRMNNASCKIDWNASALVLLTDPFTRHEYPQWNTQPLLSARISLSIFCLIILIVGGFCNALTLLTLWRYRSLRHSTRMFFLGTAFGDLFCMPLYISYLWYILHYGSDFLKTVPFLCKTHLMACQFFESISLLNLATVLTERYLLVKYPLKMRVATTQRKYDLKIVMLIIVCISFIMTFYNFGYGIDVSCLCSYNWPWQFLQLGTYFLNAVYFYVMCIAFFSSISVYRALRVRVHTVAFQNPEETNSPYSSLVPLKMSIVVAVIQCFSAIPQFILSSLYFTSDPDDFLVSEGADFLIYISALMLLGANYGVHFFIYCGTCRGFRENCRSFFVSLSAQNVCLRKCPIANP